MLWVRVYSIWGQPAVRQRACRSALRFQHPGLTFGGLDIPQV